MADARNGRLPANVFRGTPADGEIGFAAGAVAARPAPAGPVLGAKGYWVQHQQDEAKNFVHGIDYLAGFTELRV